MVANLDFIEYNKPYFLKKWIMIWIKLLVALFFTFKTDFPLNETLQGE